MNLEQWLAQHPELTAPPGAAEPPPGDEAVWVERPDDACCYCCNGTGIVADAVMLSFNPLYDLLMSPPVRCLRSPVCGGETRTFTDGELGARRVTVRRYEHRDELLAMPNEIAEVFHRQRKTAAREQALDPQRRERMLLERMVMREAIGDLLRRQEMP